MILLRSKETRHIIVETEKANAEKEKSVKNAAYTIVLKLSSHSLFDTLQISFG